MTPVSVAHWARQFGIPLRPRGSASHAAVLHPTDVSPSVLANVPPILRPVAQRVTGLRDLQWFADASTYPRWAKLPGSCASGSDVGDGGRPARARTRRPAAHSGRAWPADETHPARRRGFRSGQRLPRVSSCNREYGGVDAARCGRRIAVCAMRRDGVRKTISGGAQC